MLGNERNGQARRRRSAVLLVLAGIAAIACAEETPARPFTCKDPPEDMVCVPEGEFVMGAHITLIPATNYPRTIYLPDFAIDRDEVTVAEYRSCTTDGWCTAAISSDGSGGCNGAWTNRDEHPINCVNWGQADAYCAWRDKRLPTEAEWEKAAGGTDGRKYPWGDEPPDCENSVIGGWQDDALNGCDLVRTTAPVGSRSPAGDSPYGVKDMQGNVDEWCSDWYDWYDENDLKDPQGPVIGTRKALRGAAFTTGLDDAAMVTVSYREGIDPLHSYSESGFRCASDLESGGTVD